MNTEERHYPSFPEKRLYKTRHGEKERGEIKNDLKQNDDEKAEKRKPSDCLIDDDQSQETGTLGEKKKKRLPSVEPYEGTFSSLPQTEYAEN